jgi:hypothetical protein
MSRRNFPVISSLRPLEYTSAVSKKLMPEETAARKCSAAAVSSSTHPCQDASP